jgi:thiosulfate reductase/polysulfide reductase chain A
MLELIETSRRRFLQGSIAFCIYATSSLANITTRRDKQTTNTISSIPYLCNMCRNKCAGFAKVENSIVTKLEPNPYFPKSRNMLCPKGNAGIEALYDKDRLKYPLIRIGKRGSGKYKRVTWDEANEYIKDRLVEILDRQKDNRSTIAYCNGEGFNKEEFISFFGQKIGSSNFLDEGSICLNTKLGAEVLTIGNTTEPDVAGSDFVIIVGANRLESLITPDSIDLIKTNKKIVVIDPRITVTATKADQYIPIHPGTDLAVCLAMISIALKEELYNKDFVKKYFIDFDRFKKDILSFNYTASWASSKTNISSKVIYNLTKEFFDAKNPLFYLGRRSVWATNDFQLRRAMVLLNGLSGSINKQGGLIFGKSYKIKEEDLNIPIYANAQERFDLDGIVYGSKKGGSWLNFRDKVIYQTSPYPIEAMFIRKHNLLHNMPNVSKTKKMLQMLSLIVVIDTMPSDTAMYADVILPECTYLEREDLVVSFNKLEPSIALRNKVIEPLYETKALQDILASLGRKLSQPLFQISKKYDEDLQENILELGEKEAFSEGGYDLSELYRRDITQRNKDLIIKNFGIKAYQTLKQKGVWYENMDTYHQEIFNNFYEYYPKDKRYYTIEIDFKVKCYLKKLSKYGFDELPIWRDEYDFKVHKDKFRLLTGRYVAFTQSATTNNSMLRDLIPTNHIWINDKVAYDLNIKKGDIVEVSSAVGTIKIKAYPTNKIHPQAVWFAHGFNSNPSMTNSYQNGANDNEIIEDRFEKIYGCASMHHTDVSISKML